MHRLAAALLVALTSLVTALATQQSAAAPVAGVCPWLSGKKSANQRAHQLVRAMSIDDEIQMVHQAQPIWAHYGAAGYIPGNPHLCIPDLVLNDAGQGVGDHEVNTTAFPSGIAQASSWDRGLQRRIGRAIGNEAWHKGINVQLAPDVNIARFPMNGRNSEAFGEDPYFAGQTAAAEIKGIQDNPVLAEVKHYALNNHEVNRMTVSADASQRVIHEIYTPAFEAAVKQGHSGSVMCSYNRINVVYACENGPMLNTILKTEFGFDGFVVSDWGATHSTKPSALNGLDMEMGLSPGTYYSGPLKAAVQSGQVPKARLDDMVVRITREMFRFGIFAHPAASQPAAFAANVETPEDVALARKASEDGTVLLKNQANTLPISGQAKRIAVIGPAAGQTGAEQSYNTGGSAHIPEAGPHPHVVAPITGITQRATADGDVVTYNDGSNSATAAATAAAADIAVVVVGDGESEGQDRPDLTLANAKFCTLAGCPPYTSTNQDDLIKTVAAANPHTVVVLDTGGPMLMPWLGQVKSVLQAWFPGQEDGNALAALLFGDVNPSGKLPQTFPKSQADLPTKTKSQYPGVNDKNGIPRAKYSEGLKVGYRWYDAKGIQPLFPFGFGLSYTTFKLSRFNVKAAGGTNVRVTITVKNTGGRAGAEVPQVYVGMPRSTREPPKQLKAYTKVALSRGDRKTVSWTLGRRAFSYWGTGGWTVRKGCFRMMVGNSSRNITGQRVVSVGGASCGKAAVRIPAPASRCVNTHKFTFSVPHPVDSRVTHVVVYVDGKRKLKKSGKNLANVSIANVPARRFVLKSVATTNTGASITSVSLRTGCSKKPASSGDAP